MDNSNIGIEKLDLQHGMIFELNDKVTNALKNNQDYDVIDEIVQGLIDFTMIHFKTEEDMMHKYHYPFTNIHMLEHKTFYDRTIHFRQEYIEHIPTLADEISNYLTSWLNKHIPETDKKFADFYNAIDRDNI
jgi:hemerythrin